MLSLSPSLSLSLSLSRHLPGYLLTCVHTFTLSVFQRFLFVTFFMSMCSRHFVVVFFFFVTPPAHPAILIQLFNNFLTLCITFMGDNYVTQCWCCVFTYSFVVAGKWRQDMCAQGCMRARLIYQNRQTVTCFLVDRSFSSVTTTVCAVLH